jgi:hypothetical protein
MKYLLEILIKTIDNTPVMMQECLSELVMKNYYQMKRNCYKSNNILIDLLLFPHICSKGVKKAIFVFWLSFLPITFTYSQSEVCLSIKLYETTELSTPKQQISNTKIKVLSHVGAIKKEIIQPINEIESLIYDSENDSRTEVKPFNNIKPRQGDPSDNETPKGLLPP